MDNEFEAYKKQMLQDQFERGQLDRLTGLNAHYGCHFGMRSEKEECVKEYMRGYENPPEVDDEG